MGGAACRTSSALRGLRHGSTAAGLLTRLLLLDELQDQLEQLLVGWLSAAAPVAAALRRTPSWLLLLRRLLWRSSATISTNSLAATHPRRRAVMGVEEDGVLEEADAGARF